MNNAVLKKSIINVIGIAGIAVLSSSLQAASFDCNKASTDIEKLVCSNETASQYDEELGQYYKEALRKYPDRKEMLIRQQRNWIKWIRNSCSDPSCLATLYSARLWEVRRAVNVPGLDGTEKPNFIVVQGNSEPLCAEYVNILNRTPRNELKACKLPDLTGSSIQPVEFKPLTGEALKAMDKIVYEQDGGGPHLDWEQKWPEREKEYASGYRKLSEAYWDLDKDGEEDQIINESFPYIGCLSRGPGKAKDATKLLKNNWETYSNENKKHFSMENGYVSLFRSIKNGKLNFIDAESFILHNNDYFSVNYRELVWKDSSDLWSDKAWVDISSIRSKLDGDGRRYKRDKYICEFWFNN